jgi:uncharacterized protein (DUF2384 family)
MTFQTELADLLFLTKMIREVQRTQPTSCHSSTALHTIATAASSTRARHDSWMTSIADNNDAFIIYPERETTDWTMSTAVTLPFALNCQANGGTRSAEGNRNESTNTTGTSPSGALTIHPHHTAATDSLRAALVWNVVSGVTASTTTSTLQAPLPPPRQWRQRRTPQAQGGASSSSSERRLRIVDILDEAIAMFENDWATMDDSVRSEQSLPDTTDHHHHHHHRRDFEERQ